MIQEIQDRLTALEERVCVLSAEKPSDGLWAALNEIRAEVTALGAKREEG